MGPIELLPGYCCRKHGRLAAFDDVLRPAYRSRRIEGYDAAARQPVEEYADSGQVRYISARAVSFAGTIVCGDQLRV